MSPALLRWSKISARSACLLPKRHGSALFIPGNKATENFALLSPHLDFDSRFADVAKLRKELALRGSTENPEELARSWEFYKCVNANKWTLESRRSEIAYRMKILNKIKKLSADEEKEKMQLITEGKVLRQDMRIIKETLWEMEETVVIRALKLPNEIDTKTPESSMILRTVGEIREPPSDTERKSHVDIGGNLGLLEYQNPMHYYLCDDAALSELGALGLTGEILDKAGMLRVAGTDFGRSLVVEGSGLDHEDPTAAFVLLNNEGIDWDTCNRLHLVGGASLIAFLAMHTKQLINPNDFPLKYFATGRQYTPLADGATPDGLFTVCQSSVAHAFVMVKDPFSEEYNVQFDDLVRSVTKLYDSLDVHYRVVMRSAGDLRPWESLRVSFELWSAYSRRYVEVGHVSICGQYFSKRLLIAYQTPTGRDYPAVICGTVLSVPRLLACLLEEDPKRLRIPTEIVRHMPAIL